MSGSPVTLIGADEHARPHGMFELQTRHLHLVQLTLVPSDPVIHRDAFQDLKADFILANPPFNISDWGGERLRDDVRWKFGVPPVGNANFAWLQHIIHYLEPRCVAGEVLVNGSMSSQQPGEGEIASG